jgi:hypothetical protein
MVLCSQATSTPPVWDNLGDELGLLLGCVGSVRRQVQTGRQPTIARQNLKRFWRSPLAGIYNPRSSEWIFVERCSERVDIAVAAFKYQLLRIPKSYYSRPPFRGSVDRNQLGYRRDRCNIEFVARADLHYDFPSFLRPSRRSFTGR